MGVLSKLFRSKGSPSNFWTSTYNFLFGSTLAGKSVNEKTAMQTTVVYACVRLLSEIIASLPLHTYKHTKEGKEKAIDHDLYITSS